MKRVTVTELDKWQQCQQEWHYSRKRKLRPLVGVADARSSGSAVHDAIENALMLTPDAGARKLVAQSHVLDVFPLEHRLGPGAQRAVDAVPAWVWETKVPVAEDHLEYIYCEPPHYLGLTCKDCIQMVGKPDLWTIMDEPMSSEDDAPAAPSGILLVEFKTCGDTAKAARDKLFRYENWGVQASRYAVLLADTRPWGGVDLPIYRQHVLLSTRGFAVEGRRILVNDVALDRTRTEMLQLAEQVDAGEIAHHYGTLCDWCDYQQLCLAHLTGGDVDGIIREKFKERT